jgi:hypothetical protein
MPIPSVELSIHPKFAIDVGGGELPERRRRSASSSMREAASSQGVDGFGAAVAMR